VTVQESLLLRELKKIICKLRFLVEKAWEMCNSLTKNQPEDKLKELKVYTLRVVVLWTGLLLHLL